MSNLLPMQMIIHHFCDKNLEVLLSKPYKIQKRLGVYIDYKLKFDAQKTLCKKVRKSFMLLPEL